MKKFYTAIEAASLATKAFSLLTTLQVQYPGIRQDLEKGKVHMLGSWGAVFKQYPGINGVDLVKVPEEFKADEPITIDLSALNKAEEAVAPVSEQEEEHIWERGFDPDALRCKALLVEIIKRAAYDWVLYRGSNRMDQKELAHDAFTWLFEEDEDHINYQQRPTAEFDDPELTGAKVLTSFLSICECLNLDPEIVRSKVRKMDRRSIQCAGRPVEAFSLDSSGVDHHGLVGEVNLESAPSSEYSTSYESYGSVVTPSRLKWGDF